MVVVCLAISAIVGLDTKGTMAYQIFTFLSAILMIAMLFGLFFRMPFSAVRIMPRFGAASAKTTYRIKLKNDSHKIQSRLILFDDFDDPCPTLREFLETPEPGEKRRNLFDRKIGYYRWRWLISKKRQAATEAVKLPDLQPNNSTEVLGECTPSRRGVIRFTGLTLAKPDPFGLFNACRSISLPHSILILPKRYALPAVGLPGTRRYQSGGVALASSVGDSEEFISLREYRVGDPLRNIHWKSWAKTGKPIVKENQDEFFVRHALILDTFQKTAHSDLIEEAVSIAASLACDIQTQESLLDLMFVGPEAYCFTFGRGLSHKDKMLEILAAVNACQDKSFDHLTAIVTSRASMLSGCICILLKWDEARKKLVNHLKGMGITTMTLVITFPDDGAEEVDAGLPQNRSDQVHVLTTGKIQEGLMNI
jgi:uncharacterized protein (DUF58 family)